MTEDFGVTSLLQSSQIWLHSELDRCTLDECYDSFPLYSAVYAGYSNGYELYCRGHCRSGTDLHRQLVLAREEELSFFDDCSHGIGRIFGSKT